MAPQARLDLIDWAHTRDPATGRTGLEHYRENVANVVQERQEHQRAEWRQASGQE